MKGKVWKGILAAVLAFSMLPAVVLAEGQSTNTITLDAQEPLKDNGDGSLTIKGTISTPGADVTILVMRHSDALDTVGTLPVGEGQPYASETAFLQGQTVYINQIESDAGTGAFEETFTERSGISGKCVSAWVGGTDVLAPQAATLNLAAAAPQLVKDSWFAGEPLVLKLTSDGTANFGDLTAWEADIKEVKVNGTAIDEADYEFTNLDNTGEGAQTIRVTTSEETITSFEITANDTYTDTSLTLASALTPTLKTLPTVTPVSTTADAEGAVTFNVTGDYAEEWIGDAVENSPSGYTITEAGAGKIAIRQNPVAFVNGKATFDLEITNSNYSGACAIDVEIKTPARAIFDAAFSTVTFDYDATNPYDGHGDATGDDLKNGWGKAFAKIGGEWANNASTNQGIELFVDFGEGAELINGTTMKELPRSDSEAKAYTLTVKLADTLTTGGYIVETKTLTVAKIGDMKKEVSLAHTFTNNTAAETASFELYAEEACTTLVETLTLNAAKTHFEGQAAVGTYTLQITRLGYVTLKVACTVAEDGTVTCTVPAMVFGDIVENDGIVNSWDYDELLTHYTTDDDACDYDANGVVNSWDYDELLANYGYPNN